jgi:hypothetical protein
MRARRRERRRRRPDRHKRIAFGIPLTPTIGIIATVAPSIKNIVRGNR